MTLTPHTCSEYNPKDDTICGKPAPYTVVIVHSTEGDEPSKVKISSRKCRYHIRRYNDKIPGAKVTITAEKKGKP
jgi:hypothetical protein